jgi:tRNA (mo5U34)-methyltransferase
MTPEEIKATLAGLGWWYQNIDLGDGIWTNPDDPRAYDPRTRWRLIAPNRPDDLSGKTVLDLGCAEGYFSVMMKKRGADAVVGIDNGDLAIKQARFIAKVYGVEVDFRVDDVYRFCLTNSKRFDYVLFLGLFYHLRHPLLVLDHLAATTRELLFFQSVVRGPPCSGRLRLQDDYSLDEQNVFEDNEFPRMFFVEKLYNKDPTNWWFPNESALLAILRSAGFDVIQRPEREILVCKPVRKANSVKICDHVSFPLVTKN